MKSLIIHVFIIFYYLNSTAQTNSSDLLKIGDSLPDLNVKMINYSKPTVKLSDFNDRLLILDFWTTWCVPCVQAFPKLDSLQKHFRDSVQFMPVTWENDSVVESFFVKIQKRQKLILPSAVDTILYKRFLSENNVWSGAYVWVLKGKIVAFTKGKGSLTPENISKVLSGNFNNNFSNHVDSIVLPDNYSQAILDSYLLKENGKVLSKCVLTKFITGLESRPYADPKTGHESIVRLINLPLVNLYFFAFDLRSEDVYFNLTDRAKFIPTRETWDSSNLFSYEVFQPYAGLSALKAQMQKDLSGAFKYSIIKKKMLVDYAILKSAKPKPIKSKIKTPYIDHNNFFLNLKNTSIHQAVNLLKYYVVGQQIKDIIDETKIGYNVDLSLYGDLSNISILQRELKLNGIDLVVEKREKEMWIISDHQKD